MGEEFGQRGFRIDIIKETFMGQIRSISLCSFDLANTRIFYKKLRIQASRDISYYFVSKYL